MHNKSKEWSPTLIPRQTDAVACTSRVHLLYACCVRRRLRLAGISLRVPALAVGDTLAWRHTNQCPLRHFRRWRHRTRSKTSAASQQSHHATGQLLPREL